MAQEARDTIISVITERGGHLASNLGVVELTLALHRVFNSPTDSIVWDTTNQTYTHKLVTGRATSSPTFDCKADSPASANPAKARTTRLPPPRRHRPFNRPGHSAGVRRAAAQLVDHRRGRRRRHDLRLQLRSRQQHRPPQPGAVHRRPERQRHVHFGEHRLPHQLAQECHHAPGDPVHDWPRQGHVAGRMPAGELLYRLVRRLNTGLAGLIVPTMFWTELGFQYLGPVDGHDIKQMEEVLRAGHDSHGFRAAGARGHPQGPRLRTRRGRPGQVPPAKLAPGSRVGRAHLLQGVLADPDPPHARRRGRGGHQRRHAGRHRPGRGEAGLPGQGVRRGHCGAARSEHGRGHGIQRPAPLRLHLLHVPPRGRSTRWCTTSASRTCL